HVEQGDPGVCGDVAGSTLRDLGVAGLVEQGRDPQLEIEPGRDEQIRVCEQRHEAWLRLYVMRVLVANGDRVHLAAVAHNLASDGGVGRERRHDLDRRWRRRATNREGISQSES